MNLFPAYAAVTALECLFCFILNTSTAHDASKKLVSLSRNLKLDDHLVTGTVRGVVNPEHSPDQTAMNFVHVVAPNLQTLLNDPEGTHPSASILHKKVTLDEAFSARTNTLKNEGRDLQLLEEKTQSHNLDRDAIAQRRAQIMDHISSKVRTLQLGPSCLRLDDGTIACYVEDDPAQDFDTLFFNCNEGGTIFDCQACLIVFDNDQNGFDANDPACTRCTICSDTIAYDCANVANVGCTVRDCDGSCSTGGAVLPQACSAGQYAQDPCPYWFDGECDANDLICPLGSDCFDCDPRTQFTTCSQCVDNEGVWCSDGRIPFCSSASMQEAFPTLCASLQGGGEFTTDCGNVGPSPGTCTPEQIIQDSCPETLLVNGACDADGTICPIGSDCIDCDPCALYDGTTCEDCISNGCLWCSVADFCYSPSFAEVSSTCGTQTDQGEFLSSCQPDTTCLFSNILDDSCPRAFNGACEAPSTICPEKTDCFDCDPCHANDFTSCEQCTSQAGCVWCGFDSLCISQVYALTSNELPDLTCTSSDYVTSSDACGAATAANVFQDPLYSAMSWVYDQINVEDVWRSGITGAGVGIRVNDEGVDSTHPNLSFKFDQGSSCVDHLPLTLSDKNSHGTACAAIAAAGTSDSCSVGIAPDATISSCRIIGENPTPEAADSSFLFVNMENMQISSNSYGVPECTSVLARQRRLQASGCPFLPNVENSPCLSTSACEGVDWGRPEQVSNSCETDIIRYCYLNYENDLQGCIEFLDISVECSYYALPEADRLALIKGITEGRNGKGIIFVHSAGNFYNLGSNVNYNGVRNSRFTISVGGVGKNGMHSSYSTIGAALFCSAPGGDREFYRNNVVAVAGGGCHDADVGTSYATPVVSGVVALMLQANPELGWRDVQGIIAKTSQKTDPTHFSWITNAAGFHHSTHYGFGIVDASAAVNAAQNWDLFSLEKQIIADSGEIDLLIPEFPDEAVSSSLMIEAGSNFVVESVVVYLDLLHSSRGDLDIALRSPSGTESLLHPGQRPENSQSTKRWKLMTVQAWGESATGEWTLWLLDRREGDVDVCVDLPDWSVDVTLENGNGVVTVTCSLLERAGQCEEDSVPPNLADPNGIAATTACCACGGGRDASSFQDSLHSWRLVVYGRESTEEVQGAGPTLSPPNEPPTPSGTRRGHQGYLWTLLVAIWMSVCWS